MISSYTDDASKSIEGVNCFFLPIKIFWRREGGEGGRGRKEGGRGRQEGNPGRLDNFFSCKHLVTPTRDERTQQKMRAKTVRERNHCSVLPVFFPMCACLSMYTPLGRKTRSVSMLLRPPKLPDLSPLPKVTP